MRKTQVWISKVRKHVLFGNFILNVHKAVRWSQSPFAAAAAAAKSLQSCPNLCDPMDCSLPGSSVHGISRQEYWSGVPLPSLRVPLGIFLKQKTILILLFQCSFHQTMKMAWNNGTVLGFILELQLAIGTRNILITQSNLWNTWAPWILSRFALNLRKSQTKILKNQIFWFSFNFFFFF